MYYIQYRDVSTGVWERSDRRGFKNATTALEYRDRQDAGIAGRPSHLNEPHRVVDLDGNIIEYRTTYVDGRD